MRTRRRLMERTRWLIARTLDKLPGQCWADLVTWSLGRDRRLPWYPNGGCRRDFARCGACYCGKLREPR